jgi:hypothetical protein
MSGGVHIIQKENIYQDPNILPTRRIILINMMINLINHLEISSRTDKI